MVHRGEPAGPGAAVRRQERGALGRTRARGGGTARLFTRGTELSIGRARRHLPRVWSVVSRLLCPVSTRIGQRASRGGGAGNHATLAFRREYLGVGGADLRAGESGIVGAGGVSARQSARS